MLYSLFFIEKLFSFVNALEIFLYKRAHCVVKKGRAFEEFLGDFLDLFWGCSSEIQKREKFYLCFDDFLAKSLSPLTKVIFLIYSVHLKACPFRKWSFKWKTLHISCCLDCNILVTTLWSLVLLDLFLYMSFHLVAWEC